MARQPFLDTLRVLYRAATIAFFRLPVWILLAIPKQNRPRPSWSISRVLWVKFLSQIVRFGEYGCHDL